MNYIEIDGWKAGVRFSSSHLIPEYDRCSRLHGHTYAIHARIYGSIKDNGIILDFGIAKRKLKEIAEELDHKVIIPGKSPSVEVREKEVVLKSKGKVYVFPIEDCAILPLSSTSVENLAMYIIDRFVESIRDNENIEEVEIGVDEGPEQGAKVKKRLRG